MESSELIRAVIGGSEAEVRRALAACLDLEAKDAQGHTALHHAALGDHASMVHLLLAGGANPRTEDCNGWSAILLAADVDAAKSVRALVEHVRALVDHRGPKGNTPLHIAASGHKEGTVKALLSHGARVSAQRDNGHTPLHVAATSGCENSIRLLIEGGADETLTDAEGLTAYGLYRAKGNIYRMDLEHLLGTKSTKH